MINLIKKLIPHYKVGDYRLTRNGNGFYIVQEFIATSILGNFVWVDASTKIRSKEEAVKKLKFLQTKRKQEREEWEEERKLSEKDSLRVEVKVEQGSD